MTTAEEMALAVLRGDTAAARALADLVCENYPAGAVQLPPVRHLQVPVERLRVVLFVDEACAPMSGEDVERTREAIREWLEPGDCSPVILQGVSRVELYELLEAK